jgi:hypothetical protein
LSLQRQQAITTAIARVMKATSRGRIIVNGKRLTDEQQQEIIVRYLDGEALVSISEQMRIDVRTAKKYIELYDNAELPPQLGRPELQSMKSNPELVNYIDLLTIEIHFECYQKLNKLFGMISNSIYRSLKYHIFGVNA